MENFLIRAYVFVKHEKKLGKNLPEPRNNAIMFGRDLGEWKRKTPQAQAAAEIIN